MFKGDLVSFFMSIDRTLLLGKLLRFAEKKYHGEYKEILLRLVRVIVLHSPEKDCLFNSNPELWQKLPANKSAPQRGGQRWTDRQSDHTIVRQFPDVVFRHLCTVDYARCELPLCAVRGRLSVDMR